jgi:two-component system sensor histidine kinase UhpB
MVARRLRPAVLDDLGLRSAMDSLTTDFASASTVSINARLDPKLPPLSKNAELVLYRIAQEGLTNIARHAAASHVELALDLQQAGVVLTIVDDGTGFDGSAEGAGIRGMRERAILVGADFTLTSTVGGGSRLQLTIPQELPC